MSSSKVAIFTQHAPGPPKTISQAIICNNIMYCSGSLGIDPQTGKFKEGSMKDRTIQALRNLEKILEEGGSDLTKVIKVNIFIVSMDDYALMNEAYAEVFEHVDVKPCRTCVEVAKLPLEAEVEIECIAHV